MGDIVNLSACTRPRRSHRSEVPEGGAMVLLFTGIQYVRNDVDGHWLADNAAERTGPEPCAREVARKPGNLARKHPS